MRRFEMHSTQETAVNEWGDTLDGATVILSNPRMGTHHLLGLLHANGFRAGCEWGGEILMVIPKDAVTAGPAISGLAAPDRCFIFHWNQYLWYMDQLADPPPKQVLFHQLLSGGKYLYLLRNVLESVVSCHFVGWQQAWWTHDKPARTDAPPYDFDAVLQLTRAYLQWLHEQRPIYGTVAPHVVRYEDLRANPRRALDSVSDYLQRDLPETDHDYCKKQHNSAKEEYCDRFRRDVLERYGVDLLQLDPREVSPADLPA